MKLITRQILANEATNSCERVFGTASRDLQNLRALGPNPSPDAVDAVLGPSATEVPRCDECGEKVSAVVQVGEEECWESATAHLCRACLVRALAMIDGEPNV